MQPIRVAIADDHPLMRIGIKNNIEADPDFEVVGEASDGQSFLALLTETKPDIVILDIEMPALNGFEVARRIVSAQFPIKLIFLTMHDEEDMVDAAIELGVSGYILKESAAGEIVEALHSVAQGKSYVSGSLTSYLFKRSKSITQQADRSLRLGELTAMEWRILRMIAQGQSSKEIAATLSIHYRTVESHRTNACQKLGIRGHNSLLKFALEHKAKLLEDQA